MTGIKVDVSADTALVIFDLLNRWEETGTQRPGLDLAEWAAFSQLSASLERTLQEPLLPDYRELLEGARARIVRQAGLD